MPKAKTNGQDTSQDDVAALKKALEEERTLRTAAEGRANQEFSLRRKAEMAGMSAEERTLVAQQEACESTISNLESEIQSAEDEIARLADEPGHGKEVAALTRKIGAASAKLETESNKKTFIAGKREQFVANKGKRSEDAEVAPGDIKMPNGTLLSSFSPSTQAWLKARPDTLTNGAYFDRVVTFAKAAEAKGLKADTTDFFSFVENMLGESPAPAEEEDEQEEADGEEIEAPEQVRRTDAKDGAEGYEAERPQRRAAGPGAMSAAPPSRTVPTGGNGGGNRRVPTLNSEEREVALNLYSHLNISDADKLKKYADGKKFMANYRPQHFQGAN